MSNPLRLSGEWTKISFMGVVLAGLVYLVVFHESGDQHDLDSTPAVVTPRIETPQLDPATLALAKDSTRSERLVIEPEPVAHLLENSLYIVPSVAKELGMPDRPVAIGEIRASPTDFRGRYLWYNGILKHVSPGKPGHPVPGYRIHEGWIETDAGDTVLFQVSSPPDEVQVGDFVRVEGFFLKLRDSHHLPATELAPLLIGPRLVPDFRDWGDVTELDPAVLPPGGDGGFRNGEWSNLEIIEKPMVESQGTPLWHLAGFARHERPQHGLAYWRTVPALTTVEQFDDMRLGRFPRGDRIRILGSFIQAHTYAAMPNPLGIEYWTEIWVQVRDIGGKLIPVWVPERISERWRRHDAVEVRGYYFRGYAYETERGQTWTPAIVAATLDPFATLPAHPAGEIVKWAFFALVLVVIALFWTIARRDRKTRVEHEEKMIERRRRRRGADQPASSGSEA